MVIAALHFIPFAHRHPLAINRNKDLPSCRKVTVALERRCNFVFKPVYALCMAHRCPVMDVGDVRVSELSCVRSVCAVLIWSMCFLSWGLSRAW